MDGLLDLLLVRIRKQRYYSRSANANLIFTPHFHKTCTEKFNKKNYQSGVGTHLYTFFWDLSYHSSDTSCNRWMHKSCRLSPALQSQHCSQQSCRLHFLQGNPCVPHPLHWGLCTKANKQHTPPELVCLTGQKHRDAPLSVGKHFSIFFKQTNTASLTAQDWYPKKKSTKEL